MIFKIGDEIIRIKNQTGTNDGQFEVGDIAIIVGIDDNSVDVTNDKIKKNPPILESESYAVLKHEIIHNSKLAKALR